MALRERMEELESATGEARKRPEGSPMDSHFPRSEKGSCRLISATKADSGEAP